MSKNVISGVFIVAVLSFAFGCRQKPQEVSGVPSLKEEAVPVIQLEAVSVPSSASVQAQDAVYEVAAESSAPSIEQIQTALKNAGLYEGTVDGKIGPKTTRAIEAFQEQSNLKVDGKVGLKTWGKLKEHLSADASVSFRDN
jgi:peptidoglycan hydrolase-like protein with peptidoglycan-binding domain